MWGPVPLLASCHHAFQGIGRQCVLSPTLAMIIHALPAHFPRGYPCVVGVLYGCFTVLWDEAMGFKIAP